MKKFLRSRRKRMKKKKRRIAELGIGTRTSNNGMRLGLKKINKFTMYNIVRSPIPLLFNRFIKLETPNYRDIF